MKHFPWPLVHFMYSKASQYTRSKVHYFWVQKKKKAVHVFGVFENLIWFKPSLSMKILSINNFKIDCCLKFATGLKCSNRHRSKSIWVTSLFFCQNDSPMSESFWQKNRLVTHILFDLCLFEHFSPVANFAQQSISY